MVKNDIYMTKVVKISDGAALRAATSGAELVSNYMSHAVSVYLTLSSIEGGEPGKPPPGYKCKICESSDACIHLLLRRVHLTY